MEKDVAVVTVDGHVVAIHNCPFCHREIVLDVPVKKGVEDDSKIIER